MPKEKKSIARNILSGFLAFFLTVLLTAGTVCVSVYAGFFMDGRILDGLNYKDYYASVEEYFYQNARDMTIPSGLPPEIVNNIVDSQTIHDDIKGYVAASLKGEAYEFHTDTLKEKLTNNIYEYFRKEQLQMTQLQEETVPKYVQTIADKYVEDLKVPLVTYVPKIKQVYVKLLFGIITGVVILGGVIVFVLLRMYRWKHRGLRYIAYSTIAAAIMVAAPAFAVRISGFYKRIGIDAKHLYNMFVAYVENGVNMLFYMALGWLFITCVLLCLISWLKRKGKRRG